MAYTRTTYVDGAGGGTPVSAANLNNTEAGLVNVDGRVTALETLSTSAQTASYTLVLGDAGKVVEVTSASATNLTVPPNSSVAFPVGTIIEAAQLGAGQVTLVAGAGVTLRSANGLKIRAQYSAASLRKRATDEWMVAGDTTT